MVTQERNDRGFYEDDSHGDGEFKPLEVWSCHRVRWRRLWVGQVCEVGEGAWGRSGKHVELELSSK